MTERFAESTVDEAALAWLENTGWSVRNGTEIAPVDPAAEREDYGQVVVAQLQRLTLLPRLFSGERKVRDAGRATGEASA